MAARGMALSALTLDVEDWYQSYFDRSAPISRRVVENTQIALELLERSRVSATFFVLGEVARRFPSLVAQIHRSGHEVQCHGERHVPVRSFEFRQLVDSLLRARATIEDACGAPVRAFRAPYFSITRLNTITVFEALAKAGFDVDSSVFPVLTKRYGIASWPLSPQYVELPSGQRILEAPVATFQWFGHRIPVGGGGYFRVLPLGFLRHACKRIQLEGRPVILYAHPYEFAPNEPDEYAGIVPWRGRMQQGLGRPALVRRLRALLEAFEFGRLDRTLAAFGMPYPVAC